ncbi:MAG: GAF domain-containing sensor histidine kinase [Luteibaculaceae bacterium]
MITPKKPINEKERLEALKQYNILDTAPEPQYDEIVKLVSEICEVPISLITLVDSERQWFKAKIGLSEQETERSISFCGHAINQNELFEIPDALEDGRFNDNPLVKQDPNIRFYAGQTLITPQGHNIGTLCVIDKKPKQLNETQKRAMQILARQVIHEFELRERLAQREKRITQLIELSESLLRKNFTTKKMLSILSHDVRGPLLGLGSVLELFEGELISNDQLKYEILPKIKGNLSSTLMLVDDILQWQDKSASYNAEAEIDKVNVTQLLHNLKILIEPSAEAKEVQLNFTIPNALYLNTDFNFIAFILRNLIQNAIKFTPKNGVVECIATEKENGIEFLVKDSGIGIASEKLALLNTNSAVVSTMGTQNEKGFGLGLNLSREFAEKLGSKLDFTSEAGVGTTIRFFIPNSEK